MGAISTEAVPAARAPSVGLAGDVGAQAELASPETGPLLRNPIPVAVLGGPIAALAYISYSAIGDSAIAAFMAMILVVLAAVDLERRIIPNRIVLPALAIVLIARITVSPSRAGEVVIASLGAAVAFLLPNLLNKRAMGMGDVKFAAFLGAGLGWAVIGAVSVAFLGIFPLAVGTLMRRGLAARTATLPFGPFLAFGGLVILIVPRLVGLGG